MRVVLAESALADLDAIADWIGRDDQERAESFVESLRRHPVAIRMGGIEIRKLTYRNYLVFYLVLESEVSVIHILHGARDWAALLGEGE